MNTLAPEVPQKLFYRIQEVSQITGIKAHVLRYWETEFPMLNPQKGSNDQRRYRPADIELIRRIKCLLYEEKFTIAGARKRLEEERGAKSFSVSPGSVPIRSNGNGAGNGNGNGHAKGRQKIDRIARRLGRLREELQALHAFLAK